MKSPLWLHESQLALRAVAVASERLTNHREKLVISTKSSVRDIVTDLDVAIEEQISSLLQPSGYPLLGEESFAKTGMPKDLGDRFWAIDPIDGTVNFVKGLPLYGTCVGFLDNGFAVGAVALPELKEIYFTRGDKSYLNGKELSTVDSLLAHSLVVECFSGAKGISRKTQYELFGALNDNSRGCLRLGSAALSLCYLACGRIQAVIGFESELWDVCAGLAIAQRTGNKVLFSKGPKPTQVSFIAGTPTTVIEILALLDSLSEKKRGETLAQKFYSA